LRGFHHGRHPDEANPDQLTSVEAPEYAYSQEPAEGPQGEALPVPSAIAVYASYLDGFPTDGALFTILFSGDTLTLTVKLSTTGKASLKRHRKLKVPVTISFLPVGGSVKSVTRPIIFKAAKKRNGKRG
jgi:hypothetical protein